jgi:uncharacterized phiE125 gp8 family phage protein
MAIRWETKRPGAVRDYSHDWSAFLDGDTITSSVWTATGVMKDSDDDAEGIVTVWVSAGTSGTIATLTNTIVTAGGRTESEVFILPVGVGEPVTLAEAKAQCSIDAGDTTFDTLLTGYIAAARGYVERYTGHILVRREMTEVLAGYPTCARRIELPWRPIVSVDTIAHTDTDGADQTFEDFMATIGRYPVRIYEGAGASWPSTLDNSAVTVTFTAGYAAGEEPAELLQAMLLLIGHWFEVRETVNVGNVVSEVPFATKALMDIHRVPWL